MDVINEMVTNRSQLLDEFDFKKAIATGMLAGTLLTQPISATAAVPINMDYIQQIENAPKDPKAVSDAGAIGLYQIMPIVLKDWNNMHPREQYTIDDLYDAAINTKIAKWYMLKRIPQLLKSGGIEDTIKNRLIAYNAGWTYAKPGKQLPAETVKYIDKYNELLK